MATHDPRETITEQSFVLAPELLGKPLARPLRRGAAILLDLLFVAILVALGGRLLFWLAAGWFLFRYAGSSGQGGTLRRVWRMALLLLGLLLFLLAARAAWNSVTARFSGPAETPRSEGPPGIATGWEGVAALGEVAALRRAASEEQAQPLADRLAERLQAQGLEPGEIRAVIAEAALGEDRPWAARVADRAVQGVAEEAQPTAEAELPEDSLVLAYAAALEAGDSARIAALRPQLEQAVAAERLARLDRRTTRLERSNRELRGELEEARDGWGILRLLRTLADELGLGFGWSGLYFTAFTALWEGQTPGKWLLRIRVVRLDGKPMGWWMSFERFGGYAAGFATGLLGFLQVFWDRNRQGIHDKITETVVVRL
jgi:hypothetical protein